MNGTHTHFGAGALPAGAAGAGLCLGALPRRMLLCVAALVFSTQFSTQAFAVAVTDIEFSSRPGSKFEVRLDFDSTPPAELQAYTIERPARISIDFPDTTSELERKRYSLPYGNATGVLVLESGDRTRLILNLVRLVPYETRVDGNSLFLTVGQDADAEYWKQGTDPNTLKSEIEAVVDVRSEIRDLQFQRSPEGEGRLVLQLTDPSVDVNVFSERGDVKVEFLDTDIPERLLRRYDVTDFATLGDVRIQEFNFHVAALAENVDVDRRI
ncbi:MAG: AMIN domain-containing protein, partial [Pseudomonadota bacterium]